MATMTIGMLSMMIDDGTEEVTIYEGPTLDDVDALQRANAVALAMDEADFVQTTLQEVQPMVDSGDLRAATEHMINSLRDRIGLRGHVAMEGIGSFIASIGNAVYEGIRKIIEAIINACKAIGRVIAAVFGKGKHSIEEKTEKVEDSAEKYDNQKYEFQNTLAKKIDEMEKSRAKLKKESEEQRAKEQERVDQLRKEEEESRAKKQKEWEKEYKIPERTVADIEKDEERRVELEKNIAMFSRISENLKKMERDLKSPPKPKPDEAEARLFIGQHLSEDMKQKGLPYVDDVFWGRRDVVARASETIQDQLEEDVISKIKNTTDYKIATGQQDIPVDNNGKMYWLIEQEHSRDKLERLVTERMNVGISGYDSELSENEVIPEVVTFLKNIREGGAQKKLHDVVRKTADAFPDQKLIDSMQGTIQKNSDLLQEDLEKCKKVSEKIAQEIARLKKETEDKENPTQENRGSIYPAQVTQHSMNKTVGYIQKAFNRQSNALFRFGKLRIRYEASLILMHKGIEFVASQDRKKFEDTLQSTTLLLTYEK